MRELLKETKTWRVNDEDAALDLIEDCKNKAPEGGYTVTKSSYEIKTKKSKGEIVDMWCICSVTFSYEV